MKFALVTVALASAQECPALLEGLECRTDDSAVLETVTATSTDACCQACSAKEGCGAFVLKSSQCTLKTHCKEVMKSRTAVSGSFAVDKPEGFCPVTYTSAGYQCVGETLETVSASSVSECCEQCQLNAQCAAFSLKTSSRQCELKSGCSNKVANSAYTTAWRKQAEPASWSYKVGLGSFQVPGYQCGDKDGTTLIFYPEQKTASEKFHVVVYAHGLGGYLDDGGNRRGTDNGLDSWMQDVASEGLIVIVPFTGMGFSFSGCGAEYLDMLLALNYSKANPSLHAALQTADWSRVGAFGHSMGGSGALRVAEYGEANGLNVVATVASHGAASVTKVTVPALFTTGVLDTHDVDSEGNPGKFKHAFELCAAETKVFVNLKDGYHMEPSEGKRLNFLTAQFLSCHVNGKQEHCDYIYKSDGLCSRSDLEECVVTTPQLVV
jgi:S-formylglutathione hydrolase FrmB